MTMAHYPSRPTGHSPAQRDDYGAARQPPGPSGKAPPFRSRLSPPSGGEEGDAREFEPGWCFVRADRVLDPGAECRRGVAGQCGEQVRERSGECRRAVPPFVERVGAEGEL